VGRITLTISTFACIESPLKQAGNNCQEIRAVKHQIKADLTSNGMMLIDQPWLSSIAHAHAAMSCTNAKFQVNQ
jgi:hypothetical protein